MAETVEQQPLAVMRRTRSNAMIIDSSGEEISADYNDPKERTTEEQISNSTSNALSKDTVSSKPEHEHTEVSINPHSKSNGEESAQNQLKSQSPKEFHNRDVRLHSSKFGIFPSEGEDDCQQCKELQNMISLWELGVSGLTRNYSKILSQLNKVRNTAEKLEGQLKEKSEINSSIGPVLIRNSSVSGRKSNTVRQSMYVSGAPPPANIAEQMYPQENIRLNSMSSGSTKLLKDLNTHLSQAIDLCQQMAAASFINNQRSSKQRLRRQITVCSKLNGEEDNFRPALQSIAENNLSSSVKKRTLKRTPSAPESFKGRPNIKKKLTNGVTINLGSTSETDPQPDLDKDNTTATHNRADTNSTNEKPYYSHMMELKSKDEQESEKSMEMSKESEAQSEEELQIGRESIWSSASAFSDSDVKNIMSKIADLEEERMKLLGTIDVLHKDNTTVRLSLGEILGDLENKDLQLTLALQDLSIATGEIKRAAEMRKQLQRMESERNDLLERLSNLEDESAAVKVSLIQLLQEKSATNKTLALENWRLNQRMKANTLRREGDNVSVTSGFSSLTEDATLQEAYMGADDVASFVHKQGFLIKQGGRRKNWKNRLFVLSPEGLSYYKTEQPVQMLPIETISKVQIPHGRSSHPHPNIFEVHTPGRVFLLSAPTEDDMQSWVGMLQTLKQYNKGTTLNREASTKRGLEAVGGASPLPPAEVVNAPTDSDTESNHRIVHQSIGSEGSGALKIALDDSSDDDSLQLHSGHFGSRHGSDIGMSLSVPKSAPINSLNDTANFSQPSLKPLVRLRSDSCS